jgi:hypothetical protein
MAATRSIRVVAAASAGVVRRAAKSEISARNGATVINSSSSPATHPRPPARQVDVLCIRQ